MARQYEAGKLMSNWPQNMLIARIWLRQRLRQISWH